MKPLNMIISDYGYNLGLLSQTKKYNVPLV